MTVTTNTFEANARWRKARTLIDELTESLATACTQFSIGYPVTPDVLAQLAERVKPELWAELAEQAGVHPPSDKTVALIRRTLHARALAAKS